MFSVMPDVGIGISGVSVVGVLLYLYKQERAINKNLVASLMSTLQSNTSALTKLADALDGKVLCPLTGTDALSLIDLLRRK